MVELLAQLLPLDRSSVIVLGEEASRHVEALRSRFPWMRFWSIAASTLAVQTEVMPPAQVSAVIATDAVSHLHEAAELFRVATMRLQPDGVLVAPLSYTSHGRSSEAGLSGGGWWTEELRQLAQDSGLSRVEISDALLRAWGSPARQSDRLKELLLWAYARLSPSEANASSDPAEILTEGSAWCAGYAAVLGEALRREGYPVRWLTLLVDDHPGGRGRRRRESHEVLEVWCDGQPNVVDPMVGVMFPHQISDLIRQPALATPGVEEDERYVARRYQLYATRFLYERVRWVGWRDGAGFPNIYLHVALAKNWIPAQPPRSEALTHAGLWRSARRYLARALYNGWGLFLTQGLWRGTQTLLARNKTASSG